MPLIVLSLGWKNNIFKIKASVTYHRGAFILGHFFFLKTNTNPCRKPSSLCNVHRCKTSEVQHCSRLTYTFIISRARVISPLYQGNARPRILPLNSDFMLAWEQVFRRVTVPLALTNVRMANSIEIKATTADFELTAMILRGLRLQALPPFSFPGIIHPCTGKWMNLWCSLATEANHLNLDMTQNKQTTNKHSYACKSAFF